MPPGPRHAPDTPPTHPGTIPLQSPLRGQRTPEHAPDTKHIMKTLLLMPRPPRHAPTHARHIPRRTLHSKIATGFPDTPPTQTRHKPDASPTHSKYVNVVVRAFACRVYTDPISVYTVSPPAPVSTPCLQNGTSTTCLDGLFSRCVYVSGAPIQLQSGLLEALRLRRVSEISSVTQWPQN